MTPMAPLRRRSFDRIAQLLVVLYVEPLQVHETPPAFARGPRQVSAALLQELLRENLLEVSFALRSFTNAANSSCRGPNTAVAGPPFVVSALSAWISRLKFRQRRCRSRRRSPSTLLATPRLTS